MSFRDLIRDAHKGGEFPALLEEAIYQRLVEDSNKLIVSDRGERALAVARELVAELCAGELEDLYDGTGSYHGWFERAALLRFVRLEPLNDDEFAMAVLDRSDGVAEVFAEQYAEALGGYLRSKCDSGDKRSDSNRGQDNRSMDRATEIGHELVSDCTSGFISKYSAKGSLEGWLRTVGLNRLRTWWDKEKIYEYIDEVESNEVGFAPDPDEEEEVLIEAVKHGFTLLKLMFPKRLVVVRLVWIFNIPQRRIAAMYRMDDGDVSRLKKYGLESLRTEITGYLANRYPKHEFSWEQIISFISRFFQLALDEDEEVGEIRNGEGGDEEAGEDDSEADDQEGAEGPEEDDARGLGEEREQ